MGAYVLRRILHGLVVIVLVSLGTFFMMRVIPGDPLDIYIHEKEISGSTKKNKKKKERETRIQLVFLD